VGRRKIGRRKFEDESEERVISEKRDEGVSG
jgi:hypothetical protein